MIFALPSFKPGISRISSVSLEIKSHPSVRQENHISRVERKGEDKDEVQKTI